MSHSATNWAIRQRGLHPATKLVLWHLADRHNPDLGCFPSQDRLADDAEVSRSQLNVHLKRLEEAGLLRRSARKDPVTGKQLRTRYILSCEPDFAQDAVDPNGTDEEPTPDAPCLENGHGTVSGKVAKPCPEKGQNRVRKPDTNLVREPLREPACARMPRRARPPAGEAPPAAGPDPDAGARFWASAINGGRYVPATAVSAGLAGRMVELGLVSTEQLRNRGLAR